MAIDPSANTGKRTVFRVVGVLSMLTALFLIGSAIADFVTAGDTMPTKMWMFFLGMPFFLVGGACLQLGFAGSASRYMAGEYAPVAKDTASYLTDGKGLLNIGATGSGAPAAGAGPFCRSCGTRNDDAAKFCDNCGSSMA